MFNLDPGKMIVIAVVAIILLGPDKLPQFARQVGGAWRTFNDFRRRMESEVRSSVPDLPPTSEIARLARSPSALLTHLSNLPSEDEKAEAPDGSLQPPDGAATNGTAEGAAEGVTDGAADGTATTNGTGEGASQGAATVDAGRDETGGNGAGGTDGGRSGTDGVDRPHGVDGTNGVAPVGGGVEPTAPTTNGRPVVAPQPADIAVPADPTLN
jgi:sec-independent protein translocase protein TatB